VNLRVTGIGPIRRPELAELPPRAPGEAVGPGGLRRVHFDDGPVPTPIYDRMDLRSGDVVQGPAVIEEYGSTVPVHPGFAVRVDRWGNLILTQEGVAL
jgi:N-methylhydantoinase A